MKTLIRSVAGTVVCNFYRSLLFANVATEPQNLKSRVCVWKFTRSVTAYQFSQPALLIVPKSFYCFKFFNSNEFPTPFGVLTRLSNIRSFELQN